MKKTIFALALLVATPAVAKDVTITLTDAEQKVYLQLLDVALKQGGINNLNAVSFFVQKLRDASGEKPVEGTVPVPTKKPDAPKEEKK